MHFKRSITLLQQHKTNLKTHRIDQNNEISCSYVKYIGQIISFSFFHITTTSEQYSSNTIKQVGRDVAIVSVHQIRLWIKLIMFVYIKALIRVQQVRVGNNFFHF